MSVYRQTRGPNWVARCRDSAGNLVYLGSFPTEQAGRDAIAEFEELRDYVDPVAIERALQGDRKVYERLTRPERQALWDLLVERMDADAQETWEWRRIYEQHAATVGGAERILEPWFNQWCRKVGEGNPILVRKRIRRYALRKAKANAVPAAA